MMLVELVNAATSHVGITVYISFLTNLCAPERSAKDINLKYLNVCRKKSHGAWWCCWTMIGFKCIHFGEEYQLLIISKNILSLHPTCFHPEVQTVNTKHFTWILTAEPWRSTCVVQCVLLHRENLRSCTKELKLCTLLQSGSFIQCHVQEFTRLYCKSYCSDLASRQLTLFSYLLMGREQAKC